MYCEPTEYVCRSTWIVPSLVIHSDRKSVYVKSSTNCPDPQTQVNAAATVEPEKRLMVVDSDKLVPDVGIRHCGTVGRVPARLPLQPA
jgi:hypothetical protein